MSKVNSNPSRWKTLSAYGIIYLVWGSTFLAIRIGVAEVPPFLLAAMRFSVAGVVLFAWTVSRREPLPSIREWRSLLILAALIFVVDYGLLFWAEQRVLSGIAAIVLATIPLFTALAEIALLRTQTLTTRLVLALTTGITGVAVLTVHSVSLGGGRIDPIGAAALVLASFSWSVASVLSRRLPLPSSKVMSSGAQMLLGGGLLGIISGLLGEFRAFHVSSISPKAWFSLFYLIIAGSILGFTAYVWLISHQSPTKVGTYAYVNPVVAVLIGYCFAGEALDLRTVLGTLFVLTSVVIITTTRSRVKDKLVNSDPLRR
jgi:drug/metabolite transporter (DMT)-like permease